MKKLLVILLSLALLFTFTACGSEQGDDSSGSGSGSSTDTGSSTVEFDEVEYVEETPDEFDTIKKLPELKKDGDVLLSKIAKEMKNDAGYKYYVDYKNAKYSLEGDKLTFFIKEAKKKWRTFEFNKEGDTLKLNALTNDKMAPEMIVYAAGANARVQGFDSERIKAYVDAALKGDIESDAVTSKTTDDRTEYTLTLNDIDTGSVGDLEVTVQDLAKIRPFSEDNLEASGSKGPYIYYASGNFERSYVVIGKDGGFDEGSAESIRVFVHAFYPEFDDIFKDYTQVEELFYGDFSLTFADQMDPGVLELSETHDTENYEFVKLMFNQ